ncbi:MAG: hypothetical protein GYB31_01760 [Bacteroidetes bacterium]|nr:hypothetical protein [Bacteroidota bacterium]
MDTYIFIEGLLKESGSFELYRAVETKEALISSSHYAGTKHLDLILENDQGSAIYTEKLPVLFNHGCNAGAKVVSSASVRAAIPLLSDATKLVAQFGEKEVFSSPIGKSGPKLSQLKVKTSGDLAILEFQTDAKADGVQIYARLADKRLIRPGLDPKIKGIAVKLNSLSGQGEVQLVVEATKDLRTTRVESDPITTPPTNAKGLILEPANDSQWPYKKRGSLIASVFDENGRQLSWAQSGLFWKVKGNALKDKRQMAAWNPEDPGNYQIQLVKKGQNDEDVILSESTIQVLPPTEAQKEYEAIIKRLKETK